jgi:hypothetical protein
MGTDPLASSLVARLLKSLGQKILIGSSLPDGPSPMVIPVVSYVEMRKWKAVCVEGEGRLELLISQLLSV